MFLRWRIERSPWLFTARARTPAQGARSRPESCRGLLAKHRFVPPRHGIAAHVHPEGGIVLKEPERAGWRRNALCQRSSAENNGSGLALIPQSVPEGLFPSNSYYTVLTRVDSINNMIVKQKIDRCNPRFRPLGSQSRLSRAAPTSRGDGCPGEMPPASLTSLREISSKELLRPGRTLCPTRSSLIHTWDAFRQ